MNLRSTTLQSIDPDDWMRMSWHARQRATRANLRPLEEPIVPKVRNYLQDDSVTRCGRCGAWMVEECRTGHAP